MENNYTVYMHITPNRKKYIGITQQNPEKRWGKGRYYYKNVYFYNAIQKYGWDNIEHKILYEHLAKEEAEQKEIELIAQYKSNQREFGYNIANGGNSVGIHNELTKKKISEHNSKYWKGKHLSEETIKKQLETKRERGYFKTEEEKRQRKKIYRKKYYEEHKVLKGRKKRVYTEEDKRKMSENAKKLWNNIDEEKKKRILSNLINDGSNMRGNHHTEETKEKLRKANLGKKYGVETKKKKSETLKRLYKEGKMKGFKSKKVEQLTLNDEPIKVWESAMQIKRELGYDNSSISLCCKNKKEQYKNFKWRFLDE